MTDLRKRVLEEALNKLANEEDAGSWNQYVQRLKSVANDSFTPRIAKRAASLGFDAALAEAGKEIEKEKDILKGAEMMKGDAALPIHALNSLKKRLSFHTEAKKVRG